MNRTQERLIRGIFEVVLSSTVLVLRRRKRKKEAVKLAAVPEIHSIRPFPSNRAKLYGGGRDQFRADTRDWSGLS